MQVTDGVSLCSRCVSGGLHLQQIVKIVSGVPAWLKLESVSLINLLLRQTMFLTRPNL